MSTADFGTETAKSLGIGEYPPHRDDFATLDSHARAVERWFAVAPFRSGMGPYSRSALVGEFGHTDHGQIILDATARAAVTEHPETRIAILAAVSLLEVHDDTGIALDDWTPVRQFVESTLGITITENHV